MQKKITLPDTCIPDLGYLRGCFPNWKEHNTVTLRTCTDTVSE